MAAIAAMGLFPCIAIFSQEGPESGFSVGSDFYSSYIWRGTKYGSGPAVQPSMKFSKNPLQFHPAYINAYDLN